MRLGAATANLPAVSRFEGMNQMESGGKKPTVIVVSSHVARGAVGNRAVVFALERLGFPVVAVPTVILTWHPGEGSATRIVPPAEAFAGLIVDLIGADWLGAVGGVLSGYLGASGQAEPIAALVAAVKRKNPAAFYLCDPVIGDADGPYVAPETIAAIRDVLWPVADIATPNRHELAYLRGETFADNAAIAAAARTSGIGEVLVTSAFAGQGKAANLLMAPQGVFRATHTAVSDAPHGTGDILAALYMAHRLDGAEPREACRLAVGSTARLVAMAAGASALPIAAGQSAIVQPQDGVSVETVA